MEFKIALRTKGLVKDGAGIEPATSAFEMWEFVPEFVPLISPIQLTSGFQHWAGVAGRLQRSLLAFEHNVRAYWRHH
jgi:hypothetical protein